MPSETIYDHPLYYDILFGWDRSIECDFYRRCFERHGVGAHERVIEIACGTGQVALRLARCGWRVTGLDIRPAMLAFLQESASAEGLDVETLCGDMASFSTDHRFAAAFNPMSSFRLLHEDAAVQAHLHAMAGALRAGGIYILDLHFVEYEDAPAITTDESWEMSRNGVTVSATDQAIRVDDRGTSLALSWGEELHLRGYTPATFAGCVAAAGGFRIDAWYPELSRDTGVSEFTALPAAGAPRAGRAMVVLCRD